MASNWAIIIIQFLRLIFLARWLPINVFGIYALALSIVSVSVQLTDFGISGAFLHRTKATENEDRATAVQFTIKMSLTCVWAIILLTGTFLFASGLLRTALIILTLTTGLSQLSVTPSLILLRRITQRRIAIIRIVVTLLATPIMLGLAWNNFGVYALLSLNIVTFIVNIVFYYFWKPIWRPHFLWDAEIVKYFWEFGSRNLISSLLYDALDRIDDIWVGIFLGNTALGLYSRAYSLATYPRKILATPINWVVGGTYAELKHNRQKLSQIFFVSNAFLIRSGFFLAGSLAAIAPEFIYLVLGEKWLPMLTVFQLMLVFTLLDPIKITVSSLISLAGGKPLNVAKARGIQLVILIIGLFILGPRWNIQGVAIAVNVMLFSGMVMLFRQARNFVDYSISKLFLAPVWGLTLGLATSLGIGRITGSNGNSLFHLLTKFFVFATIYLGILLILERKQLPLYQSIIPVSHFNTIINRFLWFNQE